MSMRERPAPHSHESTNCSLAHWRSEIINDVISNGLKPSVILKNEGKPYLPSFDGKPMPFVSGVTFSPQTDYLDKDAFLKDLRGELYFGPNSILPVIAERRNYPYWGWVDYKWSDYDVLDSIVSQRTKSSFLVVCDLDDFETIFVMGKVLPNKFLYLVFPKNIISEFNQITNEGASTSVLTKIVDQEIEADMFGHFGLQKIIKVPDYEGAILEILEERAKPIWVHGVRLPTEEDLVQKGK